jgi:predicted amidohydrolase
MQDLKITIIQTKLFWENPEKNLTMLGEKIDAITEETDLIILPEMFTTGFTMNAASFAEKEKGSTLLWMIDKAVAKNADVIGSIIAEEHNKYFNRLYWVKSSGNYVKYDKRHLFRMAGEHKIYSSGRKKIIQEIKGWKILPLICYDLRFPVWSRAPKYDYDVLVYVANWPERRSSHWRLLLKARAVENQAYVIGVNRVGKDGMDISYKGESAIIDPLGNIIMQEAEKEFVHMEKLSWEKLHKYRTKFPVWMDSDTFKVE